MKNIDFKKLLPYILAIAVFMGITATFFSPTITDDKVLRQGDITQFQGAAHEIIQYREKNNEEPLWTNSMFGGMPAYQISTIYKGNFLMKFEPIYRLFLSGPISYLFLLMVSFFILLLVMGVNPWLSMAGGIAFGLGSFNLILLVAGHNTEVHTLSYVPLTLAGVLLLYKNNYFWGTALTALSLSIQVANNHLQITYYSFIIIGLVVLVEFIYAIKNGSFNKFIISSLLLAGCGGLAIGANASMLWTTSEYGAQTIRGKSDLKSNKQSTGGLDKDYAFQWSYGKMETMVLFIPNFYGGSSNGEVDVDGEFGKELTKIGVPQNEVEQLCNSAPLYWGAKPFTSGPVYLGAVIIFLFVLGMIVLKDRMKWWILAATLLSICIAWGKNFDVFNGFLFHYLPGFNKFRTVEMSLVIAQVVVPLWAFITLTKILEGTINKKVLLNALKISTIAVAGLALAVALVGPSMSSLSAASDKSTIGQMFGNKEDITHDVIKALMADRASLMRMDAFYSLIFVLLIAGLIWLYINEKIKRNIVFLGVGVLVLVDMGRVGHSYLNDNSFVDKSQNDAELAQQSPADQFILQDRTQDYRVLNLAVNTFNDASTSYYHKSVGGYHAAKLRRYQELVDHHIQDEIQYMATQINSKNPGVIPTLFNGTPVLDMLNTKYVILNKQSQPLPNPMACGNAWFVKNVKMADDADAEINEMKGMNPKEVCIVDKRFADKVPTGTISADSSAQITLATYEPNHLTYKSNNTQPGVAVFSEIYYAQGWNAYIDSKPAPYFRCNYVLRGMQIPAGQHTIEYKFEPSSYYTGEKISYASSFLVLLCIGGAIFMTQRKRKQEDAA